MLKFTDELPKTEVGLHRSKKPAYYKDLMKFVESGRKYAQLFVKNADGSQKRASHVRIAVNDYIKNHDVPHVRCYVRGDVAYLVNTDLVDVSEVA
jgi:hypothetical protein